MLRRILGMKSLRGVRMDDIKTDDIKTDDGCITFAWIWLWLDLGAVGFKGHGF